MFFSNDLLARRESGFGLLWLAATIGNRSTLKKIPRRSIVTADISSLCNLIAEPEEPLSLRLSSNLMAGVTRVYVAKHEIFATDVTNCFTSLKKAMNELRIAGAPPESLELAFASVRPETIAFPHAFNDVHLFDFDFDLREPFWADVISAGSVLVASSAYTLDPSTSHDVGAAEDGLTFSFDDGTPGIQRHAQSSVDQRSAQRPNKRDQHILSEKHLYNPLSDLSTGSIGFHDAWNDFLLPNDPNGVPAELDLGLDADVFGNGGSALMELGTADDARAFGFEEFGMQLDDPSQVVGTKRIHDLVDGGDGQPEEAQAGGTPEILANVLPAAPPKKRAQIHKPLVDRKIELTDEQLRDSRELYDREQARIVSEISAKKKDKASYFLAMDLVMQPPSFLAAPELANFWNETYHSQVKARTRSTDLFLAPEQPSKRRKVDPVADAIIENPAVDYNAVDFQQDFGAPTQDEIGLIEDAQPNANLRAGTASHPGSRAVSVNTPEIGRRVPSHAGSAAGIGSQRSSFLPWDHGVGGTGFSSDFDFGGFVQGDVGDLELGGRGENIGSLLGRSARKDGSSLDFNSRYASGSPAFKFGATYADNMSLEGIEPQSQQPIFSSQTTLEHNSYKFLEYAKMIMNANGLLDLPLTSIAPVKTSTAHVAATAFYHCLALASKDLIRVRQDQPYSQITIELCHERSVDQEDGFNDPRQF